MRPARYLFIIHALRDLRGSFRHFRLLFICLCLGVAVMSGIGSTINALKAAIERDAKSLLGGDIEIRQLYQPLGTQEMAYVMFNAKLVSRSMDMRAMAEGKDDNIDKRILVEMKGVDNFYPLYGALTFSQQFRKDTFFSNWRGGIHGAAVDQPLLDALNIKLGDLFTIGKSSFRATALIDREPDRSVSSFSLGPRVLVNMGAFKSTGLVTDTSMVNYRYRLKLNEGEDSVRWKLGMLEHFPSAYWNIRDWNDSASSTGQQIDRLSLFFVLTAMTTLIVAGIGISNAASAYMWGKRVNIAILKSLGASSWHVHSVYLAQLLMVAIVAIAYGLLFGIGITYGIIHFLDGMLPVQSTPGLYPQPMLLSAAMGLLTTLLFGLIPLRQIHYIKPSSLLKGYVDESAASQPLSSASLLLGPVYIGMVIALIWLATRFANTVRIPLYFALGLSFSLALLYVIGHAVRRYAAIRAQKPGKSFSQRMALRNLARPGGATLSIVIALGVGMSALTALSLVSHSMHEQLDRSLPENAPALFLLDVQPSNLEKLTELVTAQKGVQKLRSLPLVRGRISKLNDVPSEKVDVPENVRWALDGTRGITFSATPPDGTVITKGAWWPADYKGEPLLSFDANLARGMGLSVGDKVSIAVIDKEITGTIANLRDIPWGSLEMNFTTIFSPGALDGLPITYLTTVSATAEGEKLSSTALAKDYPGVGIIHVRNALRNVSSFASSMANAIYITASITLICGALVMASAIHATLFKRKFDTVMMKVLGMTRRQITIIYVREFALIALITSLIASIIGTASAYGIMQLLVFSHFSPAPWVLLATILGSLTIAIVLGLTATRRALAVKPLSLLRND